MKEHLAAKGFTAEEMAKSGLLVAGPDIPVAYDRFRGRLMIPIPDFKGRIIAFGGRALNADQTPKYLNSPETPLFHKGRILYNAARARLPAHDAVTVVVVEGYMDVIALAEGGITHAVAPLGTALTPDQIRILWRLAPEPILCFDGDAAGQKAAHRAADTVLPLLEARQEPTVLPSCRTGSIRTISSASRGPRRPGACSRKPRACSTSSGAVSGSASPPTRRSGGRRSPSASRSLPRASRTGPCARSIKQELRQRLKDFQWQAVRTSGRQGATGRSGAGGEADWRTRDRAVGQRRPLQPSASPASRSALARSPLVVGLSQDVTRQALMLKTLMSHPWLLDEVAEEVAAMRLSAPALQQLRDGLLRVHAEAAPLDMAGLKSHLLQSGLEDCVGFVQRALTHNSDRFAEPGSSRGQGFAGLAGVIVVATQVRRP